MDRRTEGGEMRERQRGRESGMSDTHIDTETQRHRDGKGFVWMDCVLLREVLVCSRHIKIQFQLFLQAAAAALRGVLIVCEFCVCLSD